MTILDSHPGNAEPDQSPLPVSGGVDAFTHPWVPVLDLGGYPLLVNLRDALVNGHTYRGIDPALGPVEQEALLRFLTSLTAVVIRDVDTRRMRADGQIPAEAVDEFQETYRDRFHTADPDRPFLQEWHAAVSVADKTVRPLNQMHVHVPGPSTALWCLRNETRDPADPAVMLLLLTVAWFHGKPSNSGAPACYVNKQIAGAPAGGPVDTTFHMIGHTLTETLLANVITDWLDSDSTVPVWLDQDTIPPMSDLSSQPRSLWRTTWTPNRPLIVWDGPTAVGFVNGTTARTIPPFDTDFKSSAKAINGDDYAHITYMVEKKDKPAERKKVIAPARLLSTEGAHAWYSKGFDKHFTQWGNDRVMGKTSVHGVAFYNERADTYGNRNISEWVTVPTNLLGITGAVHDEIIVILGFADTLRKKFSGPLMRASEGRNAKPGAVSPLLANTQRDFCATADPLILNTLNAAAAGTAPGTVDVLSALRSVAIDVLRNATETLRTPATFARVEEARARFDRDTRIELTKITQSLTTPITPDPPATVRASTVLTEGTPR